MSFVGRCSDHEEFEKSLKDEIARTKARMTPEELAKYEKQNKEAEEWAEKVMGWIVFVSLILFIAFVIWAFTL
jgi:hypothetical protein